MDRFIVVKYGDTEFKRKALKSNMDRFIGIAMSIVLLQLKVFKIQYG